MFGYGDVDNAGLIVQNTCPEPIDMMKCFNTTDHILTEATGYTLYALYHIVAIIVLVNALIAIMSNTLTKVQVSLNHFLLVGNRAIKGN